MQTCDRPQPPGSGRLPRPKSPWSPVLAGTSIRTTCATARPVPPSKPILPLHPVRPIVSRALTQPTHLRRPPRGRSDSLFLGGIAGRLPPIRRPYGVPLRLPPRRVPGQQPKAARHHRPPAGSLPGRIFLDPPAQQLREVNGQPAHPLGLRSSLPASHFQVPGLNRHRSTFPVLPLPRIQTPARLPEHRRPQSVPAACIKPPRPVRPGPGPARLDPLQVRGLMDPLPRQLVSPG